MQGFNWSDFCSGSMTADPFFFNVLCLWSSFSKFDERVGLGDDV